MFQNETFKIKCSDCGKTSIVSFPPVLTKPFYCKACNSKYMSKGTANVWKDSDSDVRQAWERRGESWQARKKKEPTRVF